MPPHLVELSSSLAYVLRVLSAHRGDSVICLALIHVVYNEIHIRVGFFAVVAAHPQHLDLLVLLGDGALDVDGFLNALLNLLLELIAHALLVVHVLFHLLALLAQLGLLLKDCRQRYCSTLD